ncbi:transcription elongation factor GreA [Coprothermobacteraceae bacterium]|nr:transcription elongation factor GreA [Coprothermobacteraceae bacterium]
MRRTEDQPILTEEGYRKILEELRYLKEEKRKEVAEKIQEARALGDLSENSEFEAAKEDQALLEDRIAKLEALLYRAKVVKAEDLTLEEVAVGTKVVALNMMTGEEETFVIVDSAEEVDPFAGKISDKSPLGSRFIGRKRGDVVEIKLRNGKKVQYEILDIRVP